MKRPRNSLPFLLAACAALIGPAAFAQSAPAICYTGIDPNYTNVNVPAMIHVTNAAGVATIRSNVIAYLWKTNGWPAAKMPAGVATVATPAWVTGIGSTNVGHVDRLDIAMDYSLHSIVYHIHAASSCNRLLLYHNGHGQAFTDDGDDMVRTMRMFLNAGHDVMGFCMPLYGENSTVAYNVPGYGANAVTFPEAHNRMGMTLENQSGSFIRFFLEPVVVALNYAQANYNFQDVNMVGISGGGWSTHLCAALDPRISYSFPVAGSLPLYLRVGECWTGSDDAEQVWAPLYQDTASWLDLYILGASGVGRQQIQILNQYDSCCFSGVQYQTYYPHVTNVVASIGPGLYQVYVDMGQTNHTISDNVLSNVIYPAIAGKFLLPTPQFSAAFASNVTGTSALLVAQLAGVAADVSVYWDTSDKGTDPLAWGNASLYTNVLPGATITNSVTGLTPATPYYFRFYATNGTYSTTAWTGPNQFTTASAPLQPTNFNFGMKISFPGFAGTEGLSNFPIVVELSSNMNGSGFSYAGFASGSGADLRFAASDGVTPLNFEIEEWNTNGVSYVWVEVPSLAGSNDFIWAYWGNPAQTNLPQYALNGSMWANGLAGVWHLKEAQAGIGTIGLYADSSPGRHAGDDMVSATGKQGVVDGGQQFNGTSDYIPVSDFELPAVFTISAWMKSTQTGTDFYQIVARGNTANTRGVYLGLHSSALMAGGNNGSGWNYKPISGAAVANGAWHYVACVYDQNASQITAYVDGQPGFTANITFDGDDYSPKQTTFGRNQNANIQDFPGWMDEIEISSVARSSNWVWNAWFNMASNSAFCSYGRVQPSPANGHASLNISPATNPPGYTISFDSAPGWIYRLEYRDSLSAGAWQFFDNGSITSLVFGTGVWTDTNVSPHRFYRSSAQPH